MSIFFYKIFFFYTYFLVSEENDNTCLKEYNISETTANIIEESCSEIYLEDGRISGITSYIN